ncbi:hypothetical protein H257_10678 [Aphanomyces astaci]|uniref:Uncharacterized protein n=1 Tax=Aphanomyces astaci TaxID=112090 RepID=W4G601_APHAT|nr:hypothetical protein H257_10678 [Aphanomyces astaci]ETV75085.1 hypothetical protein H257_10678 [Aphanomyces astaci]|eukprot:XP_009835590.1 hypothetical protein H257_10678 [Aphanomyces astaci]
MASAGVFAFSRTVQEEMDWMEAMRRANPDAAEDVLSNSRLFVELAAEGEVRSMAEIVADVDGQLQNNVLCYYFVKMFQVASSRRRMDVLKYMLDHGFDAHHAFVKDTLHRVIDAAASDDEDTLQPVLHLLLAHMDVNFQRQGDLFTPLHVACAKNFYGVASLLLLYGADVNAIAAVTTTLIPTRTLLRYLVIGRLDATQLCRTLRGVTTERRHDQFKYTRGAVEEAWSSSDVAQTTASTSTRNTARSNGGLVVAIQSAELFLPQLRRVVVNRTHVYHTRHGLA